jgi:hypothetical protein
LLQRGATLAGAISVGKGSFAATAWLSGIRSLVRKEGFGYIAAMRTRRTIANLQDQGLALGLSLGLSSPWAL